MSLSSQGQEQAGVVLSAVKDLIKIMWVGRRSIDTGREDQKEQKALSCLCEIKEQEVTLLHFPEESSKQ